MHHKDGWETLVELFLSGLADNKRGASARTAEAFGVTLAHVSKWKMPKEKGGLGGDIPHRLKPRALQLSHEKNLGITAAEILLGGRPKAKASA
jgi:hypothetical protein